MAARKSWVEETAFVDVAVAHSRTVELWPLPESKVAADSCQTKPFATDNTAVEGDKTVTADVGDRQECRFCHTVHW